MSTIIYSFLTLAFFLLIVEYFFLYFYKKKNNFSYKFIKKIPLNKILFLSHPYLPYVKKSNSISPLEEVVNYPLGKILAPKLYTNSMGYHNGFDGRREVKVPKPNNLIRINCIGGSTTQNCIKHENKNFSYPILLEENLKKKYSNLDIEVNNFGQGGYNSAEILISSMLKLIDTTPDYVIIYHGYNDIRSYLTNDFKSDYSHSRQNISNVKFKLYLNNLFPQIPINFINYIINKIFPSSNLRYSLLDLVSVGKIDLYNDYKEGLKVYKRNLSNIINLYQANNSKIILSSFCFYLHEKVKNSKMHNKYMEIVKLENDVVFDLSKTHKTIFIDADNLINKNIENFLDTIHFSIQGMKNFSKIISEKIILN